MEPLQVDLARKGTTRHFRRGAVVVYQGEIPRQAYYVKSGVVKMYRIDRLGNEQIVSFKTAGDLFPETWLFGRTTSALYYYEAIDDSDIITCTRQDVLDLISNSADNTQLLLDHFIDEYTGSLMQINALEQSRASEKLLLLLHYLVFKYGKDRKIVTVSVPLTHTTLANMIGLTRETVTVELGRLKRKKIVDYSKTAFVVYREALLQQLASENFSDVTLG